MFILPARLLVERLSAVAQAGGQASNAQVDPCKFYTHCASGRLACPPARVAPTGRLSRKFQVDKISSLSNLENKP